MSPGRSRVPAPERIEIIGRSRFAGVSGEALEPWLQNLIDEVAPGKGALTVRLVGDGPMRRLNREFRDLDATTDVLSFPGEESPEGPYLGDVVISVPAARRQAAARGHDLERELRTLLIHGVLHCLGYDHERDDGEMDRLERRLRRRHLTHG